MKIKYHICMISLQYEKVKTFVSDDFYPFDYYEEAVEALEHHLEEYSNKTQYVIEKVYSK